MRRKTKEAEEKEEREETKKRRRKMKKWTAHLFSVSELGDTFLLLRGYCWVKKHLNRCYRNVLASVRL